MQLNNERQFVTAKWVGLYGGKRSLFIESYSLWFIVAFSSVRAEFWYWELRFQMNSHW